MASLFADARSRGPTVDNLWQALSIAEKAAEEGGPLARDFEAREAWARMGVLDEEDAQWALAAAPVMPGEARPREPMQMKGYIGIALFKLMNTFYPNFINDEDFLDEFFSKHPVGKKLKNPRWKPKLARDRRSRGMSTYAKHVLKTLPSGEMRRLSDMLPQPRIGG